MKIGVLALQGAVSEHCKVLNKLGHEAINIVSQHDLFGIDGLIIPGGESSTIGNLLVMYCLLNPIIELGQNGLPIFGTCAGLILLSKYIEKSNQHRLGLMDTHVIRNAFGRQFSCFEVNMPIPILGSIPYNTVFIRAPYIDKVHEGVSVLLSYENKVIFAEQNNFLVTAFHPELTDDMRIHEYFIQKVVSR